MWLPHPAYSTHLRPYEYHALKTLAVDECLSTRPYSFWKNGVVALPKRRRDAMANEGHDLDY